jgi:hypothetical protein
MMDKSNIKTFEAFVEKKPEEFLYLIDKNTNEYFGKFKDMYSLKNAIRAAHEPEDMKVVSGTDDDFELKRDKDGFLKKFYKTEV